MFLARGLAPLADGRPHTGEAEEAHLPRAWVDLDEARDLVLAGQLGSPSAVTGILAAWASRAGAAGRRCVRRTRRGPPATCCSPRTGCDCLAAPEPERRGTLRVGIPDSAPRREAFS